MTSSLSGSLPCAVRAGRGRSGASRSAATIKVAAAGHPRTNPKKGPKSRVATKPGMKSPGTLVWNRSSSTGKAIHGLDSVKDRLQILDVRQIGLVAGGEQYMIHHEAAHHRRA